MIEKDQKQSTLIENRLKLDQNRGRRLKITFEIQIGPKSTIKFGRLEIRINSGPLIALAYNLPGF